MISLEGLQSGVTGEDRAIAILKVEHNSQTYNWMTFVPPDTDLATYIAASEARIKAEIDAKSEWRFGLEPDRGLGADNRAINLSKKSSCSISPIAEDEEELLLLLLLFFPVVTRPFPIRSIFAEKAKRASSRTLSALSSG